MWDKDFTDTMIERKEETICFTRECRADHLRRARAMTVGSPERRWQLMQARSAKVAAMRHRRELQRLQSHKETQCRQ